MSVSSVHPALMLTLALAFPLSAHAQSDEWLGPDKALHFSLSAGLAVGAFATLPVADKSTRLGAAAALVLALGAAKELLDFATHGDPSFKDFAWDAIGIAVGLLLSELLSQHLPLYLR